jgi:hypothetical protein
MTDSLDEIDKQDRDSYFLSGKQAFFVRRSFHLVADAWVRRRLDSLSSDKNAMESGLALGASALDDLVGCDPET